MAVEGTTEGTGDEEEGAALPAPVAGGIEAKGTISRAAAVAAVLGSDPAAADCAPAADEAPSSPELLILWLEGERRFAGAVARCRVRRVEESRGARSETKGKNGSVLSHEETEALNSSVAP